MQGKSHEIAVTAVKQNLSSDEIVDDKCEFFFLSTKDLEDFKNKVDFNIANIFDCVQFNPPEININHSSNILSEPDYSTIMDFFSV